MDGLIGVIMTTCAKEGAVGDLRVGYAEQAIKTLKNLHYDGPMRLHFADDGSRYGYPQQLFDWGHRVGNWTDVTMTNVDGRGIGTNLNEAITFLGHGPLRCDLLFYIQDDCELIGELDLTIPAQILQSETTIGMVRTGVVHPGLQAKTVYGGPELQYYWLIDKWVSGYAFTFRSWLAHRRFFQAYGPLPEGIDLYNTERVYNERVRHREGPEIAYAGNVQLTHPWRHIGKVACDGKGL